MFIIKCNSFRNLLFLFFSISLFTTTVGFTQNCKAELKVEKNRNSRSADENGTSFSLVLKNTSSSTVKYSLSTINLKDPCYSGKGRPIQENVILNVVIQDMTNMSIGNSINLVPGQTYNFKVYVSVPKGTPFNRWSCIEVQANSDSCTGVVASTVLNVFVPNPNEG